MFELISRRTAYIYKTKAFIAKRFKLSDLISEGFVAKWLLASHSSQITAAHGSLN